MAGNGSRSAPELPGFYYNPDNNRYYRLLPGHNNHNPLTTKTLPVKQENDTQIQNCKNWPEKNSTKITRRKTLNFAALLKNRSLGLKTAAFQFDATKAKLKLGRESRTYLGYSGISSILPSPDHTCLAVILEQFGCRHPVVIRNNKAMSALNCRGLNRRVSSLCFTSPTNGLLFTDLRNSTVTLVNSNGRRSRNIKSQTPFACAASEESGRVSYSDGKKTIIVTHIQSHFVNHSNSTHPRGGSGCFVVRLHQDVMSQCFRRHSCHHHFNGLRNGEIAGLDLRSKPRLPYASLMKPEFRLNAAQLLPLNDEYSLIAGYVSPQVWPRLLLWDVRFTAKPVLEYDNPMCDRFSRENISFNLSISVDVDEQLVTSVMPDLRMRIWSRRTGEVVLKYPERDSIEKITGAVYSTDFQAFRGEPGVLMHILGEDALKWMPL